MDEWGWNPASFEAIGTVIAAAIAMIALLIALGQEGLRRQRDRQAARSGQASLTSLRMESRDLEQLRSDQEASVRTIKLHLHNASTQPIHSPSLVLRARSGARRKWWAKPTEPWQPGERFEKAGASSNHLDGAWPWLRFQQYWLQLQDWPEAVAPETSKTLIAVGKEPLDLAIGGRHVGVTFRDARGLEWTCCIDGTLLPGRGLGRWRSRSG